MVRTFTFILTLLLGAASVYAQSFDTVKKNQNLHLALADSDFLASSSIFQLIDSLLEMPNLLTPGSSLVTRLGYASNITASNKPLALNQFGLSPGITYYHKSGFYLDATAYWSKIFSPSLYLTIGSLGYLKSIKKWTLNFEYSHYFYSLNDSTFDSPYTNTLTMSNFLNVKPFMFRLDYSFYFGQKNANRIMPAVMLNLEKRNWLGMDRIFIYPSFGLQLGNEAWKTSAYVPYTTQLAEIRSRIRNNLPLYYLQNNDNNSFGILNYIISFPVSISVKDFSFQLSYSYYFPQALPHEPVALNNSGYLSFSIIRYFNFKSPASLIDFYKLPK